MAISQTDKPSSVIGIYVIVSLVCLISLGSFYNFQTLILYIFIPILFLIALRNDLYTIHLRNKEIIIYVLFVVLTLTTVFYRIDYELFYLAFNGIMLCLLTSYIPLGLNKNKDYEVYFHIGFIISMVSLILIEYSLGNFSLTGFASTKASRGRFFYNANYYSYISYFANFSLFYLHLKYRNIATTTSLIILPLLLLILAFITQSRSGLLFILMLNGLFWFTITKDNKSNIIKKVVKKVILIAITFFFVFKLIDTYQNSQIKNRVTNSSEDSRTILAYEAINVFTQYPFTGVGLGQFPNYTKSRQFSHNSYTEVLAEHGITGGLLLIALFGIPTYRSFKNLKNDIKNPVLRLNFLFFTSFLLYNNAYVFYKASYAMVYFFLIISIQHKMKIN